MLFRRSTACNSNVTASTMNFFPGPPWTRALVGAAKKWQQRQRRGEELLRCPRRALELGQTPVWANQHTPFSSELTDVLI
eukprot:1158808-Pelagomonas_calceolata.AAC.5